MQNKWTEDKKKQGLLPSVGEVVAAILGINEEVRINVRGYSMDGKMVFGQDVSNAGGAIICNVDWLHPIQSEREKYNSIRDKKINDVRNECILCEDEEQAFALGARVMYEALIPSRIKINAKNNNHHRRPTNNQNNANSFYWRHSTSR